jgi:hypothetical protein
MDDIAGLVDSVVDLPLGALDGLLSFVAETLCLSLEIVSGVLKIIASVFDALAELLSGFDPGLWSVEKSDGGTCADADPESEPIILCAHVRNTSYLICVSRPVIRIPGNGDWLVIFAFRRWGDETVLESPYLKIEIWASG